MKLSDQRQMRYPTTNLSLYLKKRKCQFFIKLNVYLCFIDNSSFLLQSLYKYVNQAHIYVRTIVLYKKPRKYPPSSKQHVFFKAFPEEKNENGFVYSLFPP